MHKDDWWFAQTHMKDSSLIAWPVRQKTFKAAGKLIYYFEPVTDHTEIKLISIWDVKDDGPCTGRVTITPQNPNKKLKLKK